VGGTRLKKRRPPLYREIVKAEERPFGYKKTHSTWPTTDQGQSHKTCPEDEEKRASEEDTENKRKKRICCRAGACNMEGNKGKLYPVDLRLGESSLDNITRQT